MNQDSKKSYQYYKHSKRLLNFNGITIDEPIPLLTNIRYIKKPIHFCINHEPI